MIGEAANMITEAIGFRGEVVYDTNRLDRMIFIISFDQLILDTFNRPDGQIKKTASTEKLRKLLPDFEFTPLKEAIQATVDWYVENHEMARK